MSLKKLLFTLCILSSAQAAEKPNVLLLFIDDMGWKDIAVNGSTFYETPNIDNLAASGVNFTSSYSAHPVCSPTRASLMTGKAPQRMGITQWISGAKVALPLEEVTLGEAFKEYGYRTGYIGKWHLGKKDEVQPDKQGFDHIMAVNRAGQPSSYFAPYSKPNKKDTDVPDLSEYKTGHYLTDAVTDKALDFINIESEQPFFLCLSHYAVHTPIQAPKELVEKYKAKKQELFGDSPHILLDEKFNTKTRQDQNDPAYAAMVENLDTNIGRVIDNLKDKGLLENTIVIFTSDNGGLAHRKKTGGPTSNLPLRSGKAWMYEGGTRIPTIISWPGTIKAASNDTPIITMDYFPTLLELTGQATRPELHLDGKSLKPLLQDEAKLEDRFLAWTYPHNHGSGHKPANSILDGHWKLIQPGNDDPTELYDLCSDPGEKTNLAPQELEKVKELKGKLSQWLAETNK